MSPGGGRNESFLKSVPQNQFLRDPLKSHQRAHCNLECQISVVQSRGCADNAEVKAQTHEKKNQHKQICLIARD